MRRRRYQKGSLQARRHGKKRVWVVQYYDADGHHRYQTVGRMADLTKSQAQEEQVVFMRTINGGDGEPQEIRPVPMPSSSTKSTCHFSEESGSVPRREHRRTESRFISLATLEPANWRASQQPGCKRNLDGKAITHGFSGVDHLRWDLTSIFDLAVAEKVLTTNPAKPLYTPPPAKKGDCPVMTAVDVETALGVVEFREKVILHLAIFSGLRPGEMLAIHRRNVSPDGRSVEIEQRVCRGELDQEWRNQDGSYSASQCRFAPGVVACCG